MTFKNLTLLSMVALVFTACQSAPAADKATTSASQQVSTAAGEAIAIDTTQSTVTWIGTKPVGQHEGIFKLQQGMLTVADGELTGGEFAIDMNTLSNIDLEGDWKKKLEIHLKSPDFFDVQKYPSATFTITSVQPFDSTKANSTLAGATHLISGNLKLKDSTKNITFPAVVTQENGAITAHANFNIDRTQWGLSYGNDKSLQDNFIRPEVNIQLNIAAGR